MQQNLRARRFGITFASIGIVLAFAGWLTEKEIGNASLAQLDLAILFGCGVSLFLTFTPLARGGFYWWPAYLVAWLALFPVVQLTGGLTSPYFNEMFLILFGTGVLIQTRFSPRVVAYFAFANLLYWIGDALMIDRGNVDPEWVLASIRSVLFLACSIVVIGSLLKSEASLAKEKASQIRNLAQAREELAHSARMAELGGVMATTAHELAQPVQVITMSTGLIRKMAEHSGKSMPKECRAILERLVQASHQISGVLKHLRDFSRKESFHPVQLDLREAARRVLMMCSHDLKVRGIALLKDLGSDPAWVTADPLRVQQVLFNLINNSRDAVAGDESPRIELTVQSVNGRGRIHVWNSGPPIPLAIQAKLFQPLFTTKEKGEGTGIGLAICSQIAEQHGGRILFHSSPEFGTEFVLDLPAGSSGPGLKDGHAADAEPARTSATAPSR